MLDAMERVVSCGVLSTDVLLLCDGDVRIASNANRGSIRVDVLGDVALCDACTRAIDASTCDGRACIVRIRCFSLRMRAPMESSISCDTLLRRVDVMPTTHTHTHTHTHMACVIHTYIAYTQHMTYIAHIHNT